MYLFWNFDISQESSAYPNFRELPRKKPKIHLGGYPSSLEDAQGSSTGEGTSHQKWTPSLQQEALWFRSPSLVQACSGQLHQSKGGEKRAFCCDLWCSGENELGKICENFVIHHHTYCRFCVLLPHICVQFVYVHFISFSTYFPVCSGFVNNGFAQILGKNLSSELQHKPWIDALAPTAGRWSWLTKCNVSCRLNNSLVWSRVPGKIICNKGRFTFWVQNGPNILHFEPQIHNVTVTCTAMDRDFMTNQHLPRFPLQKA